MSLTPGSRLGAYEVLALIGAGGPVISREVSVIGHQSSSPIEQSVWTDDSSTRAADC